LRPALRSRLEKIEFGPYSVRALRAIAHVTAPTFGFALTSQAAGILAEAAQGSPRLVCKRLEVLSFYYPDATEVTKSQVSALLGYQGIDTYGLCPGQRRYLQVLAATAQGVCSLEGLSQGIGLDATMVRQDFEPYLLDQKLIEIASRGRTITEKGRSYAAEYAAIDKAAEEAAEQLERAAEAAANKEEDV
jgi:Holliday junction resolvasome RuvABC ATP-dependent DNA helicase subunit